MSTVMRVHFDPLNHYDKKGFSLPDLKAACGILPEWAIHCEMIGETMSKALEIYYPFFFGWTQQTKEWDIDDKGIFKYDGDPDCYPFCTLESSDEFVYIYPSAVVGVVCKETGDKKYSRFD